MYVAMIRFNLVAWDAFGIDWDGSVPMDGDESIVTVEVVEDILSASQKEQLKALLSPVAVSDTSQQEILTQFTVAKYTVFPWTVPTLVLVLNELNHDLE